MTVRAIGRKSLPSIPSSVRIGVYTLPEYDVLDAILHAYIEEAKTSAEIAEQHHFPLDLVRGITMKVDRNEYKRQQAAPGLKVTSKAFGVGRRIPIAQRFAPVQS